MKAQVYSINATGFAPNIPPSKKKVSGYFSHKSLMLSGLNEAATNAVKKMCQFYNFSLDIDSAIVLC